VQIIRKLTALALDGAVKHEFLPGGVEWELRISTNALPKAIGGSLGPAAENTNILSPTQDRPARAARK
jgi:hypothetical protein